MRRKTRHTTTDTYDHPAMGITANDNPTRRVVLTVTLMLVVFRTAAGYGEKVDTLLIWQERAVAVLTNACRMAPIVYRDRFIGNSTILLTENYPAVAPVYWNRELNAAARFHCVQMALDCGMTHTCNGIPFGDRLREFYTGSGYIGENIAAGYRSPQEVVNGWLIDGRTAETAAPDGNGDGHRANIMSGRFTEMGCGYFISGSGRSAAAYWCQDFGGGRNDYIYHPVSAASHLFFDSDTITFMANLYDTAGAVTSLTLLLAGERLPFVLTMGSDRAGTWEVAVPVAASCRTYAVEAAFADGETMRYPENGMLTTVGEGSCTESDSGNAVSLHRSGRRVTGEKVVMHSGEEVVTFTIPCPGLHPVCTEVIDCNGTIVKRFGWSSPSSLTVSTHTVSMGIRLVRHRFSDGTIFVHRWVHH